MEVKDMAAQMKAESDRKFEQAKATIARLTMIRNIQREYGIHRSSQNGITRRI